MATSSAPCGGDAYRPWNPGMFPEGYRVQTCDTCDRASREAAETAASERVGFSMAGRLVGPFGKCLGAAGLGVAR